MGYMKHHAIVVTTWNERTFNSALAKAQSIGLVVCFGPPLVNGYRTMCVVPDGSKEGWPESDGGDELRTLFKGWLRSQSYGDGSSLMDWCEASFSPDDRKAEIVESQWTSNPLPEAPSAGNEAEGTR